MFKLLTFPGQDDYGNIFVQAITPGRDMEKTASGELFPRIRSFINDLTPCSSKVYVLVNALGAGEYYGSNINGDFFEESELNPSLFGDSAASGYKTFLASGIYRHHKNKDRERSLGTITCACYNPVMHRVELILEIDKQKAREEGQYDLVDLLDRGGHPAVSMGCKVKYDVCSICGHQSKTRADYCIHTKTMMGKILPDGRKVFVKNPKPKFFDLSFVVIGADRTSYAMLKVASSLRARSSAELAEEHNLADSYSLREKLAARSKISTIIKRVPAMSAKIMPKAFSGEQDIPRRVLDSMSEHPLRKVLTSTASSGIVLKPKEYQRIILMRMGKRPLADRLDREGAVFPPSNRMDRSISLGNPLDHVSKIRDLLRPLLEQRSMFEPMLTKRIVITIRKRPPIVPESLHTGESPLLNKIADGYNGYRHQLFEKISQIVEGITAKDFRLLSDLSESGFEDMMRGGPILSKTASKLPLALLGIMPLTYLYGAHVRKKAMGTGKSAGPIDRFIEQHPIIASSIFLGLTRLGTGLYRTGQLNKQVNKLVRGF